MDIVKSEEQLILNDHNISSYTNLPRTYTIMYYSLKFKFILPLSSDNGPTSVNASHLDDFEQLIRRRKHTVI